MEGLEGQPLGAAKEGDCTVLVAGPRRPQATPK